MTLDTVGFGRSFPRIWIVPIGTLIVVFGLAVVGEFSRAVAADFLAWWPVWVGLGVGAVVLRQRMFGVVRASGVVPLVAVVMVGLFVWGHLAGWSLMPSASQRLVGPTTSNTAEASLSAVIDGVVEVAGADSEFLYVVEPASGGGSFGIPTAIEESLDSTISVEMKPDSDPGLYTYSGWDIQLSNGPEWSLDIKGAVTADLTNLVIVRASIHGAGMLVLGQPSGEAVVTIDGQYDVLVPSDTPVSISGVASVPDTWTLTSQGAESSAGGAGGWSIIVAEGATVRVAEA